jgi:hypothetical protein
VVDHLDIVGRCDDEVHCRCELPQCGFGRRNPLDGVWATKQLVREEKVRLFRLARANDVDDTRANGQTANTVRSVNLEFREWTDRASRTRRIRGAAHTLERVTDEDENR